MESGNLPGMDASIPNQIVCHVDMDCFYASCEQARDSTLKGQPVVVGMGYNEGEDTGAVATANYAAREYGVEPAQPISEAIDLLPHDAKEDPSGIYLPVDMEYYEQKSKEVMKVLENMSETLRIESVDEAYLDVTDLTKWHNVGKYAEKIKENIKREVGVTASVGVAPTMGVAKIASDYNKPDGVKVVRPDNIEQFLYPLTVGKINGVGPVTENQLEEMNVNTVADLAEVPLSTLITHFGERGRDLYKAARGIDDKRVTPQDNPKSFSREAAVKANDATSESIQKIIIELAEDVAVRANKENASYQTITLKLVSPPYEVNTRAKSLSGPINNSDLVEKFALELLQDFSNTNVRKIGVQVSKLTFADGEQTRLDGWGEDIDPLEINTPEIPNIDEKDKENQSQSTFEDFNN